MARGLAPLTTRRLSRVGRCVVWVALALPAIFLAGGSARLPGESARSSAAVLGASAGVAQRAASTTLPSDTAAPGQNFGPAGDPVLKGMFGHAIPIIPDGEITRHDLVQLENLIDALVLAMEYGAAPAGGTASQAVSAVVEDTTISPQELPVLRAVLESAMKSVDNAEFLRTLAVAERQLDVESQGGRRAVKFDIPPEDYFGLMNEDYYGSGRDAGSFVANEVSSMLYSQDLEGLAVRISEDSGKPLRGVILAAEYSGLNELQLNFLRSKKSIAGAGGFHPIVLHYPTQALQRQLEEIGYGAGEYTLVPVSGLDVWTRDFALPAVDKGGGIVLIEPRGSYRLHRARRARNRTTAQQLAERGIVNAAELRVHFEGGDVLFDGDRVFLGTTSIMATAAFYVNEQTPAQDHETALLYAMSAIIGEFSSKLGYDPAAVHFIGVNTNGMTIGDVVEKLEGAQKRELHPELLNRLTYTWPFGREPDVLKAFPGMNADGVTNAGTMISHIDAMLHFTGQPDPATGKPIVMLGKPVESSPATESVYQVQKEQLERLGYQVVDLPFDESGGLMTYTNVLQETDEDGNMIVYVPLLDSVDERSRNTGQVNYNDVALAAFRRVYPDAIVIPLRGADDLLRRRGAIRCITLPIRSELNLAQPSPTERLWSWLESRVFGGLQRQVSAWLRNSR